MGEVACRVFLEDCVWQPIQDRFYRLLNHKSLKHYNDIIFCAQFSSPPRRPCVNIPVTVTFSDQDRAEITDRFHLLETHNI